MKFDREQFSLELVAEMMPLWKSHYEETHGDNYGELNPDLRFYETAAGILRIFTARTDDGKLCGYQVYFVAADPHSAKSIQAVQDILYLSEEWRKGWEGYRFIKWCVEQLEAEGVDVIHQRISVKNQFGPVLERMGFNLEDLTYSYRVRRFAEV